MNASSPSPIRVYRRASHFAVMLAGFLFFVVLLLLDRAGVTSLGWFAGTGWLGYGLLAFSLFGAIWLGIVVGSLRVPVIEMRENEVMFAHTALPNCRAKLDLDQIIDVTSIWQPDTVPTYIVLHLQSGNASQAESRVWTRRQGSEVYFECSNLTLNAIEIAKLLNAKLRITNSAT